MATDVYALALAAVSAQLTPEQRATAAAKMREWADARAMSIDEAEADFLRSLAANLNPS
jgi:hypothetical protein